MASVNTMVLMTTTHRTSSGIQAPGLTFGDPSKIKILKKIRPTIIGGSDIVLSWTYDFSVQANTSRFRVGTSTPGFYAESEYMAVEFMLGDLISRKSLNCTGTAL